TGSVGGRAAAACLPAWCRVGEPAARTVGAPRHAEPRDIKTGGDRADSSRDSVLFLPPQDELKPRSTLPPYRDVSWSGPGGCERFSEEE
ncbi:hypothetical protein NFI96_027251, partial [Prochilodus magdalenae]